MDKNHRIERMLASLHAEPPLDFLIGVFSLTEAFGRFADVAATDAAAAER